MLQIAFKTKTQCFSATLLTPNLYRFVFRHYGTKCGGCNDGISPNELVRKAKDQVYHLKCFVCITCEKQLSTGEELYILPDHKFLCKTDYLNSKHKDGELLNPLTPSPGSPGSPATYNRPEWSIKSSDWSEYATVAFLLQKTLVL